MVVHIQEPEGDVQPIVGVVAGVGVVGCPTALVGYIGSAVVVVVLREGDTGSAGDQVVEGVLQQDGSNSARADGCLCSHRT